MVSMADMSMELRAEAEKRLLEFKEKLVDYDLVIESDLFDTASCVFVCSDFVFRSLMRNPLIFVDLVKSGDLERDYGKYEYKRIFDEKLDTENGDDALIRSLRMIRAREAVRIAWRDLAGKAQLGRVLSELSLFADACLDTTLSVLYSQHCMKYGTPYDGDGKIQKMVVLGMGKLGGEELNFSSDVDLIFAYPENGETRADDKNPQVRLISIVEFFSKLARKYINVLSQVTAEGQVFRVDMRLRPDGENGPIVMSFDNTENYYLYQGREWERYALIKARVVAGDRIGGEKLLNALKPFVYRRYIDYGAFESLREMKQKIEIEVKRKGMKQNVKLGPGGIREIEFFCQVFQLIRGGIEPTLQERNLLNLIEALAWEGHINEQLKSEFTQAYTFLRNAEHRLQEFADRQTHDLPRVDSDWERLAFSMGFDGRESFERELDNHRERVQHHFMSLLEAGDADDEKDTKDADQKKDIIALWHNMHTSEEAANILHNIGYDDPEGAFKLLEVFRSEFETRLLSREGRARLDKLMPRLIGKVADSEHPVRSLDRILTIIKTIERRINYLSLLLENPIALTQLVKLSDASPWIAGFLAMHPALLDELLDTTTLYTPPEKDELVDEIRRRIELIPDDDLEALMEEVRVFKQVSVLRVAAADITSYLPLMRVSDHLTYIAEAVLDELQKIALRYLHQRHGLPACKIGNEVCEQGFAIIAYGKLGGIELGYASDIDLVFVHAGTGGYTDGDRPLDAAGFFARLGQRMVHFLSAHTAAGKLYEVDMRLRPSGTSGLLVSQIESFRDYQLEGARVWEHQSIVRARAVCGDEKVCKRFEDIRKEVICFKRDNEELRGKVVDMREKMRNELFEKHEDLFDLKQQQGGIVDIEFIVQYLVLKHAHQYNDLAIWPDNVRLLETLAACSIISQEQAEFLKGAYLIYRAVGHRLSLQKKEALAPEDEYRQWAHGVMTIWNEVFEV